MDVQTTKCETNYERLCNRLHTVRDEKSKNSRRKYWVLSYMSLKDGKIDVVVCCFFKQKLLVSLKKHVREFEDEDLAKYCGGIF